MYTHIYTYTNIVQICNILQIYVLYIVSYVYTQTHSYHILFIHHRFTVLQHDCRTSVPTKHAGSSTCELRFVSICTGKVNRKGGGNVNTVITSANKC